MPYHSQYSQWCYIIFVRSKRPPLVLARFAANGVVSRAHISFFLSAASISGLAAHDGTPFVCIDRAMRFLVYGSALRANCR